MKFIRKLFEELFSPKLTSSFAVIPEFIYDFNDSCICQQQRLQITRKVKAVN